MKLLKTISLFLFLFTFITSCSNDTSFVEEQLSLEQDSSKGLLSARTAIDADSFGHQLDAVSGATIQGYNFSPSSYERESNDFYFDLYEYFGYNDEVDIKAMDYNKMDELVYFIGEADDESSERYLYSLDKETEEVSQIGLFSEDYDYDEKSAIYSDKSASSSVSERHTLGKAHDLTFDANGNLYVAFKSGRIMKYDLETNGMELFVDLNYYEFYIGAEAVGFTYDFDNDRLLYSSLGYDSVEDIEGFTNYYYDSFFIGIDCASSEVSELFTLRNDSGDSSYYGNDYAYNYANTTNMDYIGNNIIVYSDWYGNGTFHAVDVMSGEYVFSDDDNSYFYAKDLMYTYNPDVDGDGVLNEDDAHPNSDMSEEISFDGCYPGVANTVLSNGSTMADEVDDLIAEIWAKIYSDDAPRSYDPQKDFQREMTYVLAKWYRTDRVITDREKSQIVKCVRSSRIFEMKRPT